jgi:uncharacterized protein (DUF1800 family)
MMHTQEQTVPSSVEGAWAPYVPDAETRWDLRRVVHLHRRAGFAATWGEIQRDLADGPAKSIDRLLAGRPDREGVHEHFSALADGMGDVAAGSGEPARLKAWWMYRMLFGPDPLGERLTLLWHSHFATSNLKVDDLRLMRRQNETFRKHARAPFAELLNAAVREPALLVWLDAPSNHKGHPNENLGRELMELFTLGIGPYTEVDVKEAARALTGWTVEDGVFREVEDRHDSGEKTILGRKGRWTGSDLVKMVLEHPATANRLAFRVCELFLGEKARAAADVAGLAAGLRQHNLDVGWAVGTVLRSRTFFAEENLRQRVLAPAEFVIGATRALELFEPPSSTVVLAEWVTRLGQDLFYPPNVGGWPGGASWLTTRAVIGRANYAAAVVEGQKVGRPGPMDALGLARRHGQGAGREEVVAFYTRLLLGVEPTAAWRARLAEGLARSPADDAGFARHLVSLILAMPEAQLA